MGGVSSSNRRVRNDDWARIMGGLSSDYPRIEAIRGFFAHILNSDLWWCWRVTPLAPRFVLDVSWEPFLVAGAIFGEVGVSLFVAGAECWEILGESRSAKCCIIPYKVRRQDGRGKLFEAAGARWWFYPWTMVGLSSDHARIAFIGRSNSRVITLAHHHHGTVEGWSNQKKRFGHRTGSSPCGHSIGNFFLWFRVFFMLSTWNFHPMLARELLVRYSCFMFTYPSGLCENVCVCLHLPLCVFFFAPLLRRIHWHVMCPLIEITGYPPEHARVCCSGLVSPTHGQVMLLRLIRKTFWMRRKLKRLVHLHQQTRATLWRATMLRRKESKKCLDNSKHHM